MEPTIPQQLPENVKGIIMIVCQSVKCSRILITAGIDAHFPSQYQGIISKSPTSVKYANEKWVPLKPDSLEWDSAISFIYPNILL